jgi:hypothetical protein
LKEKAHPSTSSAPIKKSWKKSFYNLPAERCSDISLFGWKSKKFFSLKKTSTILKKQFKSGFESRNIFFKCSKLEKKISFGVKIRIRNLENRVRFKVSFQLFKQFLENKTNRYYLLYLVWNSWISQKYSITTIKVNYYFNKQ